MIVRRESLWLAGRATLFMAPLFLVGSFSPNPFLATWALLLVPLFVMLLWRPGEPPALLFAVGLQWMQVSMPVLTAGVEGRGVDRAMGLPEAPLAVGLGLFAVFMLAFGMRLGAGLRSVSGPAPLKEQAQSLRFRPLLAFYAGTLLLSFAAAPVGGMLPGLRQPLLALAELRWIAVFLLLWAVVAQPGRKVLGGAILFIEIILGLGGYFSAFKYVLFLAIVVLIGAHVRLRSLLRPSSVGVILLSLGLVAFWQAVKDDYRAFLDQGTRSQAILVSPRARVDFLVRAVSRTTVSDLTRGIETALERVGYIEYFARSIRQVPARMPHQNGRLWGEAVRHVLMPRLFFPDKPVIDDSERTNEFTGVRVAGAAEGSSISIGYAAESYIDFGAHWMWVPILCLGIFWGLAYRVLIRLAPEALLGLAAATNLILSQATLFESSNIKLVGGGIMQVLVLGFVLKVAGRPLWRSLTSHEVGDLEVSNVEPAAG